MHPVERSRKTGTPAPDLPSHRRPGSPLYAAPGSERPHFWKEFGQNSRTALSVVVGGLLGVVWGASTLASGSMSHRLLGVAGLAAGVVVWASYFLRFNSRLVSTHWWAGSRPRLLARALVLHAWQAFLVIAFMAWVVSRVL